MTPLQYAPVMQWCVVYRTGGTERFEWRRTIPVLTEADALWMRDQVVHMGYHALVVDFHQSERLGLPDTWD